jgi:predicted ATP-dependent serine protease
MPVLSTLLVVDSVQTIRTDASESTLGSVTQIPESTAKFVQLAKSNGNL